MKSEHHESDANASESSTAMNNDETSPLIDHTGNGISSGSAGDSQSDKAINPREVGVNLLNVHYVYRQDIVRCGKDGALVGMVTEVAGQSDSDSDSESDISDDDDDDDDVADDDNERNDDEDDNGVEDDGGGGGGDSYSNTNKNKSDGHKNEKLPAGQVRVIWIDHTESTHNLSDVTVVDRGFLHGDIVASASDPTGKVGIVVDAYISVDLQAADGSILKDISSKDLKRVREFTVGDHVILGHWLGRVDDVLDNVTVLFDDGSMCKVMKADPMRLKPVCKSILEDGNFPYYPGQRVKATSSTVFKDARWLSGLWKASRMEGTVTKVAVGSVFIYWIASASSGYGSESATAPAEEQSPKNLKLLSCFSHANWQVGDWCILPSSASTSSPSTGKDSSRVKFDDPVEDPPVSNDTECDHVTEKLDGNGDFMDLDAVSNMDGKSENVESNASPESSSCSSSLSVSKNCGNEGWPSHRKKMRKVVVRDKKVRKKKGKFQRAHLIVNTKTKVDVAWQDGKTESGLVSTTLIPIDSPGDHEFFAEQYVVEKASDDGDDGDDCSEVKRVGVVKCVDAKERTACVKWLKPVARPEDPREFDKEEVVSVYELEGHPDYDYCHGDVVVRLSPVSVSAQTVISEDLADESGNQVHGANLNLDDESESQVDGANSEGHADLSDLSWVGNITGLKDGDIEVTWADGMISTVGPQAIYVVGRDDEDDSIGGGSEISDGDAATWETVDEDQMDALENVEEETAMQNETEITSEVETTVDSEENSSGQHGPLSIPLAALGYVTRLATGFFSRGKKHDDLDSSSETDLPPRGNIDGHERRSSIDGSTCSQESNVIDGCDSQTTNANVEEHGLLSDDTDVEKAAEALFSLRSKESDSLDMSGCHGDNGFKHFDTAKDPIDHHFLGENGQNNNGRKWLKKVHQDWQILQKNLPDDIYVRVYEDRMDLIRAIIVGAYGTPYQDGLFVFDFHLPPDYPSGPPSVYYHSGGWRINPNLYEEGKVCLSLLNTWTGRGNEVWDPSSSSILQVLVSLQGLVLNSRPYFNEAGYDKQVGTAEGEKNSLSYNENTFLLNCKSMMYLMRKPPKDFEDLVKDHFKRRGHYILKACDAYMKGYLIGSLTVDASINDQSIDNSTSVGFKLMLAKIMPKLISALSEVGANTQDFKRYLPES